MKECIKNIAGDCITYIIRSDIDEIFNGKKLQSEFVKIFGELIQNEKN
jgi:hypothetical protein